MKPINLMEFLETVPEVDSEMLRQALWNLALHYAGEARMDYHANPTEDHLFFDWVFVMKWLKQMDDNPTAQ